MATLQTIRDAAVSVLNDIVGLSQSTLSFHKENIPATVVDNTFFVTMGSIEKNETTRADASAGLCSNKERTLIVRVVIDDASHTEQDYEDLIYLEETIEDNLLTDSRTAPYLDTLVDVKTEPDSGNAYWLLEMIFSLEYQRTF